MLYIENSSISIENIEFENNKFTFIYNDWDLLIILCNDNNIPWLTQEILNKYTPYDCEPINHRWELNIPLLTLLNNYILWKF